MTTALPPLFGSAELVRRVEATECGMLVSSTEARAGCDLATLSTELGSKSQQNV